MPNPEDQVDRPKAKAKAKAHPTKAFFVRMLTRDITLEDCILDLIDNSVDAAWSSVNATPTKVEAGRKLSKFQIDITFSEEGFEIKDNCGGISFDDAVDYAFTFGRDQLGGGPDDFTIGVYGIGMKRAVFKLGNKINVRSSPAKGDSFAVPINVKEWMARSKLDDWDFDIDAAEGLPQPGVEIQVVELDSDTALTFSDPGFEPALRNTIARDYLLSLMQGLTITLNDKPVEGWDITFRSSPEFQPMRQGYGDGEVTVEIYAGMNRPPPSSSGPTERETDRISGWYVLCNGRVVVAADRSDLTVWGQSTIPNWHGQYKGFVGLVLFSSKQPSLLPMTTTKRSVDESSSVYRRALVKMRTPTRAWIDYTNARKTMTDEAREKESKTTPIPIEKVKARKSVKLPKTISGKKDANILYTVSVSRVRALGKEFGRSTMAYAEVGRKSFEYAYERLVGGGSDT